MNRVYKGMVHYKTAAAAKNPGVDKVPKVLKFDKEAKISPNKAYNARKNYLRTIVCKNYNDQDQGVRTKNLNDFCKQRKTLVEELSKPKVDELPTERDCAGKTKDYVECRPGITR